MRSPLLSTGDVRLVCPWAGEENGLTCDTGFKLGEVSELDFSLRSSVGNGLKARITRQTVLLPSPRADQPNVTGGEKGRTHQPRSDASDPHYLRRQRHDKTFDREIFAVSANVFYKWASCSRGHQHKKVRSQRREPKGLDFLTSCVAKGRSRDSAIVSHHRPLKHLKSAGKSETEADNLTNVTWQWSGQVV
ncbi:unnamed protein product [Nesidiocoris tenuis]|uniref:Uncharacterized protein n=1 Tax=Nesidiocoris tenuis TaxID=355587 RepID=A0A6H5GCN7_9HEMI|nr:unnamed protein product [Nesidiocoris tenuis]